jgi:hypothetical protein
MPELRAAILVLAATVTPSVAQGAEPWPLEPKAYREIPFGGSVEDARRALRTADACFCTNQEDFSDMASCKPLPERDPTRIPLFRNCPTAGLDVAGTLVKEELYFERDRFVGADWEFERADFAKVEGAVIKQYGPPMSREDRTFGDNAGAHLTDTVLTWRGPHLRVRLERFKADFLHSGMTIFTNDFMKRRQEVGAEMDAKGPQSF